jgi:hypothetical protein
MTAEEKTIFLILKDWWLGKELVAGQHLWYNKDCGRHECPGTDYFGKTLDQAFEIATSEKYK